MHLGLFLPALRQIENDAFIWTPNLITLVLYKTGLETLAEYSFRGLIFWKSWSYATIN